ncbi:MAG: hypothetical protein V4695_11045 [Pseudomonadota bacterium]
MGAIGNVISKVVDGIGGALEGVGKMVTSALTLDFSGVMDGAKDVLKSSPVVAAASSLMDGASGGDAKAKKDATDTGAKASAAADATAATAATATENAGILA